MDATNREKSAIAIFCYNRPGHLNNLLETLQRNETKDHKIYLYVDGPKNFHDSIMQIKIREILEKRSSLEFESICFRNSNLGLNHSIRQGVDEILKKHDSIIVLEDDLLLDSFFISYMNSALELYYDYKNIGTVSGYSFVSFSKMQKNNLVLSSRHSSWGWGTWKDRWENIDWSVLSNNGTSKAYLLFKSLTLGPDYPGMIRKYQKGKIQSWSLPFDISCYFNKMMCIHPRKNLVINNGFDGTGINYNFKTKNLNKKFSTVSFNFDFKQVPQYCLYYNIKLWFFSLPILRIVRNKLGK
jgi:hypothetical protein